MGPQKVTPEDQQFNIAFVSEVKKHPCLFDSNSAEYKHASLQDKAWQAVSAEVNESVDMCKKRWRNLRCCMTRYLKSVRENVDNSPNLRRKPYYLYNHMQFVIPYLKAKDGDVLTSYDTEDTSWIKNNSNSEFLKPEEEEEEEEQHEIDPIDIDEDNQQIKQSIIQSIKILPVSGQDHSQDTTTYEIIEASPSKQPRIESVQHLSAMSTPVTPQTIIKTSKDGVNLKHITYTAVATPQHQTNQLFCSPSIGSGQTLQHQIASSSGNLLNSRAGSIGNTSIMAINAHSTATSAANDADNNFFKSLIPDIQSMTMDQKRKLKIGILRLIDEILSP
ncbi:uncharacterized protein LOC129745435 [Uranotaenia lowii]|uniref:uncharacterized protein LOC129745435 n=1 Tax=Uranotaenia lowii TaxID=190385 RepID=UPI00247B1CF9|nr:uncharacterized protein LOC129745435 [Uranotaenia lowii]